MVGGNSKSVTKLKFVSVYTAKASVWVGEHPLSAFVRLLKLKTINLSHRPRMSPVLVGHALVIRTEWSLGESSLGTLTYDGLKKTELIDKVSKGTFL